MANRWTLSRAGIVNVYQYGDETLHFHGGRLLLRGVNGSGKSTAMNMLLPFLLDTDTRRIDAAGEQSGVLRSWMLSGRDEQQPVGYLWIEFRRPDDDDYVTIGCGIRANRSTDRVTTWWFVTPRRPGIDLSLVEKRTPLAIDALRAVLGPHAVFAHDQRNAYRAQVRDLLFGGADVDQHIRLLHVLRSPRVGDRIDVDLPQYLDDALPQLSEDALDDAAQPLEDLEEHRRNVEDLTRTAAALDALESVYRGYARAELHRRAAHLRERVAFHAQRRREEGTARREHDTAVTGRDEADALVKRLVTDEERLRAEVEGLKASDIYKRGTELNELRKHVRTLDAQVAAAKTQVETHTGRLTEAREAVAQAGAQSEADLAALQEDLSDLASLALAIGLTQRPPGPPRIDTHPSPTDGVEIPSGPVDVDPVRAGLADLRAGLVTRGGDVEEVRTALAAVDRADLALRAAETAMREAETAEGAARDAFAARRVELDAAVQRWRAELNTWVQRLDAHRHGEGLAETDPQVLTSGDLAGGRDDVTAALLDKIHETAAHHQAIAATLAARRSDEQSRVDTLAAELDELQAMSLPHPPAAPWQRPERGPCLAELVDFGPGLDPAARAGIEAALEAAGLLGAELSPDGDLVLADGQLVAAPGRVVAQPLARYLAVAVPDDRQDAIAPATVAAVLDAISTDPDDLTSPAGVTVVTSDGRFRAGALRGRHTKAQAEHVGVSARRAALERRRSAVAADLEAARAVVQATDAALADRRLSLAELEGLRQALPPARPVAEASAEAEVAERALGQARVTMQNRRDDRLGAERAHADAVDGAQRTAAEHGLPDDREGLALVVERIGRAQRSCDTAGGRLTPLVRIVAQWIKQAEACDRSADDLQASQRAFDDLDARRAPEAARLATLDDAIGLDYQEVQAALAVSETDLAATTTQLEEARSALLTAHGQLRASAEKVAAASERRGAAGQACVDALPQLREALAVPGLVASALTVAPAVGDQPATAPTGGEPLEEAPDRDPAAAAPPAFPVVAATPEGAQELADRVTALIPAPDDAATSGESVRQSLRRRRDALGAGWDAEDHQPDEDLPLHIEVTGPLGRMPLHESARRAGAQLRSMAGLLSAKQDQALRNLLQGLIAREVAAKLLAAKELVGLMNRRLDSVTTSHGIGVSLRWQRRDDLDAGLADTIGLLAKPPDLRTSDEEHRLARAVADRIAQARAENPDAGYRELIAEVLDYRRWHRMVLMLRRPGRNDERLNRRTALSEGEKKMVSYLPLFAAVAASSDALAEHEPAAPRFVLLDDAFAKVSEDNHAKLFGLMVEMDLDFVATSERLWGTHETVPELAITEVLRDATLGVIVLEHSRWDGHERTPVG